MPPVKCNNDKVSVCIFLISPQREDKNRLSVCSKICYAIGGAPYQITGCALGFFLQIYLLDVAQVRSLRLSSAAA